MTTMSDEQARIRGNVHVTDSDCWVWQGYRNEHGYGRLWAPKRYVHRAAYEAFVGPIPAGLNVLHRCDNPPCCNPAHLFLGTRADNARDMLAKGRGALQKNPALMARSGDAHWSRHKPERIARGDRNGARTRPDCLARGDRHGSHTRPDRVARGDRNGAYTKPESRRVGSLNGGAKLTEEQVREIRRLRNVERVRLTTLAAQFGVSEQLVSMIARGVAWKHVG
jgi:hypothetical protein